MTFTFVLLATIGYVICYLLYAKWQRRLQLWKTLGVKSATPMPLLGNLGDVILGKKHTCQVYDEIYNAFPDEPYVGHHEFGEPTLLIRDPKVAHRIMVQDFNVFHHRGVNLKGDTDPLAHSLLALSGDIWKNTRAKLVPAFSSGNLKHMFPLMQNCVKELERHLEANQDKMVDIREAMFRYSTDVIGHCALGIQCNALANPNAEFRTVTANLFKFTWRIYFKFFCAPIYNRLSSIFKFQVWTQAPAVSDFFFRILNKASEDRKIEGAEKRIDFLQLMLDVRERDLRSNMQKDEAFDDKLFVSNMFIFFSAGFETTANTLSYCVYELAINQDMQDRLRKEIKTIFNDNNTEETQNQEPSYYDVKSLKYLDMIISETLRKYPPLPFAFRVCDQDYTFPETGLKLNKGTKIIVPFYSYQKDSKYFPQPEKFIPERFEKMDKSNHAYIPFGDGPRICIGMRFAKTEIKACLVSLLSKYKFTVCEKTDIPLGVSPKSFFLTPINGITLNVPRL